MTTIFAQIRNVKSSGFTPLKKSVQSSLTEFTTKRAERQRYVRIQLSEASAARKPLSSGFTLIETMVAITIVALAIAGPLTAASRAVVAGQISRDQLTATYLAQEGVEYVRAVRDDYFLALYPPDSGDAVLSWNNFVNGMSGCEATACSVDPNVGTSGTITPCPGGVCSPLYLSGELYTQASGGEGAVKTPFTRTVQVSALSATEERVTSTVSWSFHGTPYSVSTNDHLTAWQ